MTNSKKINLDSNPDNGELIIKAPEKESGEKESGIGFKIVMLVFILTGLFFWLTWCIGSFELNNSDSIQNKQSKAESIETN